ncbi:MAG: enoyl-CoA hydratase/isomerase family protein [Bacteroidota bacterium]|nr:enoyl-CoA hydratase/isomerase family protein [Bacteroidota bacterium]
MGNYATLLTSLENGILTVWINRPEKLNALNRQVFDDLELLLPEIYSNPDIAAVIITGQGEKSFIAGADISEMLEIPSDGGARLAQRGQQAFSRIEACPKPVVAAINGFALGGGCELAMACHFRVASSNARFGQPEVTLGLIPGYGGTQRLPMLVGKGKAMELMMTGAILDAADALKLGLVNYVTEPGQLLEKTREILTQILSKSPTAVAGVIEAVNAHYDYRTNGMEEEARIFGLVFASSDKTEGTEAFLQKRKPQFRGK